MEQTIILGVIQLKWSDWITFEKVRIDNRVSKLNLPKSAGVYEVVMNVDDDRLTIGKTGNLCDRLKCLIRGNDGHSAGKKIKGAFPDEAMRSKFLIRFALTSRPAAIEEELHRLHKETYGILPRYTDR